MTECDKQMFYIFAKDEGLKNIIQLIVSLCNVIDTGTKFGEFMQQPTCCHSP